MEQSCHDRPPSTAYEALQPPAHRHWAMCQKRIALSQSAATMRTTQLPKRQTHRSNQDRLCNHPHQAVREARHAAHR